MFILYRLICSCLSSSYGFTFKSLSNWISHALTVQTVGVCKSCVGLLLPFRRTNPLLSKRPLKPQQTTSPYLYEIKLQIPYLTLSATNVLAEQVKLFLALYNRTQNRSKLAIIMFNHSVTSTLMLLWLSSFILWTKLYDLHVSCDRAS